MSLDDNDRQWIKDYVKMTNKESSKSTSDKDVEKSVENAITKFFADSKNMGKSAENFISKLYGSVSKSSLSSSIYKSAMYSNPLTALIANNAGILKGIGKGAYALGKGALGLGLDATQGLASNIAKMAKNKNKSVANDQKLPANKILESSKLKKYDNIQPSHSIKITGGTNYIATKKAIFNGGTNIINVSVNGRNVSGVFTPKLLTDKNKIDDIGLSKKDKEGALTAEVVKGIKDNSKQSKLTNKLLGKIDKRATLIGSTILLGAGALAVLTTQISAFLKNFKFPSLNDLRDSFLNSKPMEKFKDIPPVKKINDTRKDLINKSTEAEKTSLAKINSNVTNDVGGFNNKALGKMMEMSDAKIKRNNTIDVGGTYKGNTLIDKNKLNDLSKNGAISKDLAENMQKGSNSERVTPSIKKFSSSSAKGTVLKFPVTIKIKEDKPTADKLYHILTIERVDKTYNPLHKSPRLIITGVTKVMLAKNIKIPPNTPFCIVDEGFEIGGDISAFMQGEEKGFENYINDKNNIQDAKNLDAVRTKDARDKYNKQYKNDTNMQILEQVSARQVKNILSHPVDTFVQGVKDIPDAYKIGKQWVGEKANEVKDLWNKNETILNNNFNKSEKSKTQPAQNQTNISNGTNKLTVPSNQGGTTIYGPYTADLQYMSAEQTTIGN